MSYEKNISAEQDKEKKVPWIPSKDGNSRRETYSCKKKTERTSPADHISFSFKKEMHIRKAFEFRRIRKGGTKHYGKFTCFQYTFGMNKISKLGLTVSKKYGNSVERNFFKRRIRELFRFFYTTLPSPIHLNICPLHTNSPSTYDDLYQDWIIFFTHLQKNGPKNESKP